MPRSHIHGSPRRFYYGFNLTDDPGNANFRSPIRMHYTRVIKYYTPYDYGCNKESYGPIRITTNVHPWLIRPPARECVTWALVCNGVARTLKKLRTSKGDSLDQAMIVYINVPFKNGNFS